MELILLSNSYGGEALGYLGGGKEQFKYEWFNHGVIDLLNNYLVIKVFVVILLLVLAFMIVKNLLGIRSIFTAKSVVDDVGNFNRIRDRDARILKTNKIIRLITRLVMNRGIRVGVGYKDYIAYNLERANVRIPGRSRCYTPDEFNSIKVIGICLIVALGILLTLFVSPVIGVLIMLIGGITVNAMPMMIIRQIVVARDNEIREDFPDLYLMIHYEIVSGGNTPLERSFRSYKRVTKSVEMLKFVDRAIELFETYGEIEATNEIAKYYREIPEVTRLMRLINQLHTGGNVQQEFIGFREQILKDKKYRLEEKMNKLVGRARMSFKLAYIILIQAIISAMALFMPRLDLFKF